MGITGTDVTKNVADTVLSDDNFATIVSAVEEGRRIYDNIRKAIQYLLSSNLAEVLSIFIATLLGFTILEPVHLLWINLITDCLPALALGMERSEPDIMRRRPRSATDGIFAGGRGIDSILQGVFVTALTLFSYFTGHFLESGVWEIANSPDGITTLVISRSRREVQPVSSRVHASSAASDRLFMAVPPLKVSSPDPRPPARSPCGRYRGACSRARPVHCRCCSDLCSYSSGHL